MIARKSRVEVLAEFFRARPGEWHDGMQFASFAGSYAWRTRLSELRRAPFLMTIENRQRTARRPDGATFTISEYRYLPAADAERRAS